MVLGVAIVRNKPRKNGTLVGARHKKGQKPHDASSKKNQQLRGQDKRKAKAEMVRKNKDGFEGRISTGRGKHKTG